MKPVAHPQAPGWKAEFAATLHLAAPLVLANLLQMLTYSIDVIFIARIGPDALAASALAIAIFGLLVWAFQGMTSAAAPIMAAELGARAPALRPVRRTMRMALWLSILMGAIAMLICSFAESIMRATGQEDHIIALANEYMDLLLWANIPLMLAGVLRVYVSTLGRPFFATLVTALGIGVNALGNWLLIFGNWGAPALGLQGAAIATIITGWAIVLFYVIAIATDPRLSRYHIFGFFWRPDWARLKEIVRIGTPIGWTIMAEAGIFGAAAFLMGRVGAMELAAHTLALQIASLAFQVPMGVGQAATIRVGYFYGAKNPEGVRMAGWVGIAVAAAFMFVTAALMLFTPEFLLTLYIDTSDPANAALVSFAVSFLVVAAAFQFFDAVQVSAAGALRGLQDTSVPMWIAIFSYWVPGFGLAAGLGLATELAGVGVWSGLATGLLVASILLLRRWIRRDALGLVPPAPVPPAPVMPAAR